MVEVMGALTTFWKACMACATVEVSNTLTISSGDTVLHSWEVLAKILASEDVTDIICDIGMCVFEVRSIKSIAHGYSLGLSLTRTSSITVESSFTTRKSS